MAILFWLCNEYNTWFIFTKVSLKIKLIKSFLIRTVKYTGSVFVSVYTDIFDGISPPISNLFHTQSTLVHILIREWEKKCKVRRKIKNLQEQDTLFLFASIAASHIGSSGATERFYSNLIVVWHLLYPQHSKPLVSTTQSFPSHGSTSLSDSLSLLVRLSSKANNSIFQLI